MGGGAAQQAGGGRAAGRARAETFLLGSCQEPAWEVPRRVQVLLEEFDPCWGLVLSRSPWTHGGITSCQSCHKLKIQSAEKAFSACDLLTRLSRAQSSHGSLHRGQTISHSPADPLGTGPPPATATAGQQPAGWRELFGGPRPRCRQVRPCAVCPQQEAAPLAWHASGASGARGRLHGRAGALPDT